jgi:hypothetical protein
MTWLNSEIAATLREYNRTEPPAEVERVVLERHPEWNELTDSPYPKHVPQMEIVMAANVVKAELRECLECGAPVDDSRCHGFCTWCYVARKL